MNDIFTSVSKEEQYRQLKAFSSDAEKDSLILDILCESSEYEDKEAQVENAFGNWQTIQKRKVILPAFNYLVLARSIKGIDPEAIRVGMRFFSQKLEIWVICKEKDYSIIDKIYDIYESMRNQLPRPVAFVFIGEDQFIGRQNVSFISEL